MTPRLGMVTMDSHDAEPLGQWWAEQTGAEVVETNGGEYVVVKGGSLPIILSFQVPDATSGRTRRIST